MFSYDLDVCEKYELENKALIFSREHWEHSISASPPDPANLIWMAASTKKAGGPFSRIDSLTVPVLTDAGFYWSSVVRKCKY